MRIKLGFHPVFPAFVPDYQLTARIKTCTNGPRCNLISMQIIDETGNRPALADKKLEVLHNVITIALPKWHFCIHAIVQFGTDSSLTTLFRRNKLLLTQEATEPHIRKETSKRIRRVDFAPGNILAPHPSRTTNWCVSLEHTST